MKRKWKYLVMLGLLVLTLGGCTFSKDSYADEEEQEEQGLIDKLNSIPEEGYRDWINEKVQSGELVELDGSGEAHAYGDSDWSVVTDPDLIEELSVLFWGD